MMFKKLINKIKKWLESTSGNALTSEEYLDYLLYMKTGGNLGKSIDQIFHDRNGNQE